MCTVAKKKKKSRCKCVKKLEIAIIANGYPKTFMQQFCKLCMCIMRKNLSNHNASQVVQMYWEEYASTKKCSLFNSKLLCAHSLTVLALKLKCDNSTASCMLLNENQAQTVLHREISNCSRKECLHFEKLTISFSKTNSLTHCIHTLEQIALPIGQGCKSTAFEVDYYVMRTKVDKINASWERFTWQF